MSKTWFWVKFSFLMIFSVWVGLIALPNSAKETLPAPMAEKLSEYQLKLGIDLSGGTQLEYQVDFVEAEKRAENSLLDEDPDNDVVVDKKQISNGVVKTLKKRIDPDGTKEVNIFASERGEDWFVIVELTEAIDTPENRSKLEKVTSLQFREPVSEGEQITRAQKILAPLVAGEKEFTEISEEIQKDKTGTLLPLSLSQDEFSQFFGEKSTAIQEEISGTEENIVLSDVISSQFGPAIVQFKNKTTEDTTVLNEGGGNEVESVETFHFDFLILDLRWKDTGLGGAQFRVAKTAEDQQRNPVTSITFDQEGGQLFADITGRLGAVSIPGVCGGTGQQFAIFVDGVSVSDPCVHERIDGGSAQISFGATSYQAAQTEAAELAENLNSGATPAPVSLISERKISASLGEKAFEMSINAALIGFALVTIWIIFFYRFYGVLAIVALAFYAAVLIAILKSASFLVLTLSGIAGIILSIGMAVDANILIFERIKEELREGKKYSDAVEEGFDRAWSSIKDSNVSSLITCFILWALGTSIIKAFAITLAIGIGISMFTAITFTWYLAKVFVPKVIESKHKTLIGA